MKGFPQKLRPKSWIGYLTTDATRWLKEAPDIQIPNVKNTEKTAEFIRLVH